MIVEIDSRNIHPERTLRNVIDAVFIIVAWKNFLRKEIVCSEKEPEKAANPQQRSHFFRHPSQIPDGQRFHRAQHVADQIHRQVFFTRPRRTSIGSLEMVSAFLTSASTSLAGSCCSSSRRPSNNSVTEIPSSSASGRSRETSGTLSPRSHLLTALSETYSRSARSFCVQPFSRRNCARNDPNACLFSSKFCCSTLLPPLSGFVSSSVAKPLSNCNRPAVESTKRRKTAPGKTTSPGAVILIRNSVQGTVWCAPLWGGR